MFEKVFVIAEGGSNHNGNLTRAKEMIWAAREAGADAIKFQHLTLDTLFAPEHYENVLSLKDKNWREEITKISFKNHWIPHIREEADRAGIIFFSTPFSVEAVDELNKHVPFYKVASGDITFFQLLEKIGNTGKGVFLSTGGSNINEIDSAVKLLKRFNPPFICLLHCIMLYPPPLEALNLRFIHTLIDRYKLPVGLSDHTTDEKAAIIAVGMGAKAVEKHFTLDKSLPGSDHINSLNPEELKRYIEAIRESEKMLGDYERIITGKESKERLYARRSLYALKNIKKGETLNKNNITFLRPVVGIKAEEFFHIIGKKVKRDIKKGEPIYPEDI